MVRMRRVWTRLAVLGLPAAVACGGHEPAGADAFSGFCAEVRPRVAEYLERAAAEHPVPADPRYGGTAVVGSLAELPGGLNAAISTDANSTQYQQFVAMMTLVRYDADLLPEPYLARSWEVNADTTALTFHLRTDVFWHDGVRTDAGDVAFTYRTVTNPATAFPNPAYWDLYDRGPGGVEVVDDSTITFHLRPHADFLDAWRATAILPEHLLADVPPERLSTHPFDSECPVGNGPFAFVEHRPNDRWVFEANAAFPAELGGRPYLDRLVHRVIPEQTTLLTELLTGGIQVYMSAPPDQAKRIEADPDVDLLTSPHREVNFLAWNARRPQLADRRVRTALTMGVDRERIVRAVIGDYGRMARTTVTPTHWQFDPEAVPEVPYDPDGARALLDEAGWRDRDGDGVREDAQGRPLTITLKYNQGSRSRQTIAELVQAQLADIGVDIRPQAVDVPTFSSQLFTEAKDFDGAVLSWVMDFRLDDRDMFDSNRLDGPFALSGTNNAELDRFLDTLQTVVDRAAAKPLWDEYQRLLVEEQPYTFLYFADRIAGVRKSLHDVKVDTRGELVGVHDWWLDPSAR
jgi:peptide/nickel transport system substrate-binding protein